MSPRNWLGVMVGMAVAAISGFGAWNAVQPRVKATALVVPRQSSLPKAQVASPPGPMSQPTMARAAGDESAEDGCGPEFRSSAEGSCTPVDPATGEAYSPQRLEEFETIRRSAYVARGNFLVPRRMTPAEAKRHREMFAKAKEIGRRIEEGEATQEEIEDFFGFRARVRGYREQLLTFEHARTGGRLSPGDPVLDREEIENPDILSRYDELDRAMRDEYAQKDEALRRIALDKR